MDWASGNDHPPKRQRSDLLALALIVLLVRGGERVALLGSGMAPAAGRGILTRLAMEIDRLDQEDGNLPPPHPLPRFAQLVLFSDFLSPLGDINRVVRRHAERGVRGHLVQILDPAEESLPYEGRILFEGLENEEPWLLARAEGVREEYHQRLQRQIDGLEAIAQSAGWTFARHRTDISAQSALLSLYTALTAGTLS